MVHVGRLAVIPVTRSVSGPEVYPRTVKRLAALSAAYHLSFYASAMAAADWAPTVLRCSSLTSLRPTYAYRSSCDFFRTRRVCPRSPVRTCRLWSTLPSLNQANGALSQLCKPPPRFRPSPESRLRHRAACFSTSFATHLPPPSVPSARCSMLRLSSMSASLTHEVTGRRPCHLLSSISHVLREIWSPLPATT